MLREFSGVKKFESDSWNYLQKVWNQRITNIYINRKFNNTNDKIKREKNFNLLFNEILITCNMGFFVVCSSKPLKIIICFKKSLIFFSI